MERRARAHASKRRGAHKHPRLPLLLQIHPLRSVARRARIGPTRTGLHRRGSARARGKGRERRADHLPHPLSHLASKRCRRRSFYAHPQRALAGGPASPRVNPPLPTPRRARASLPPPSLRSAHAPPLFRIPGPAGLLVARRSLPLTRPRPCPRATGAPLPLLEPGHPPARRTRLRLRALKVRPHISLRRRAYFATPAYLSSSRVFATAARLEEHSNKLQQSQPLTPPILPQNFRIFWRTHQTAISPRRLI